MEIGVFFSGAGTGLVVGGGLVYGFRGWIQRTKTKVRDAVLKEVGALRQDAINVHAALFAAVDKDEATLKAAVTKAIATLRSHL